MGPRNAVRGVADACGPPPFKALCGAPYGATKRYTGYGGRKCPPPLRPCVELHVGSRNAAVGAADA
eukprot:8801559-Pyramimonas_sp.AAC.1